MPYIPNTPSDQQAMLEAIGVSSMDELFAMIPEDFRFEGDLDLPPAMSELEVTQHVSALAHLNLSVGEAVSFLGAGMYDHFIPAVVDYVASRGEFLTAYTPYQAEASQGTLQAIFEYQTLLCRLTGMDVANASMYDGATAATEGVLMARAATRRDRIVVAESVHPEYRRTLATYLENQKAEIVTVTSPDGTLSVDDVASALDDKTACLLVQHPNFFGCLEDVRRLAEAAHEVGALLVIAVDPISLGLLERPGDYGADIVVAEGQSLGIPMGFGGPGLGIMACREKFLRRMPGRLVGMAKDRREKDCYVLTMQTREQHIRRERATSNICTNQGLMALRATVYLAAMGPDGLKDTAELCLQKACYAADRLTQLDGCEPVFNGPTFKEFVVRLPEGKAAALHDVAGNYGVFPGLSLECFFPEMKDMVLVSVTEKRTSDEIDILCDVFAETLSG